MIKEDYRENGKGVMWKKGNQNSSGAEYIVGFQKYLLA